MWEPHRLREGEYVVGEKGEVAIRGATGRSRPYEATEEVWLGEDLDRFGRHFAGATTEAFYEALDRAREALDEIGSTGKVRAFRRIDLLGALSAYERHTAIDHAMFVAPVDGGTLRAQRRMLQANDLWRYADDVHARDYHGQQKRGEADVEARNWIKEFEDADPDRSPGGWSNADVMRQTEVVLRRLWPTGTGGGPARLFRESIVPAALGVNTHRFAMTEAMIRWTQAIAGKVAANKEMRGALPPGLVHYLEWFGKAEADRFAPAWQRNAAGWLYSSTLGLNVASVLLNVTQPMLHLGVWMGAGRVLGAYPEAIADMGRYFRTRTQMFGAKRIGPAERRAVAEQAGLEQQFEVAGISGDVLEDLDRLAFSERQGGKAGGFEFATRELPLKAFEKAEWLNRLVAFHAVRRGYGERVVRNAATGRWVGAKSGDWEDFIGDAQRMVWESQFGAHALNTPMAFMRQGSIFSSPLVRQFLTFSMRTPLAFLEVGPRVHGGVREGMLGFSVPWWVGDSLRAMGISAAAYEVGKNVGVDTEQVGIVPAVTDVLGGERILERGAAPPFMTPPALDVALDAMRGVLGGEKELLGDALARLVPGGVAFKRLLEVAPGAKERGYNLLGLPGIMQRRWADWEHPAADGKIPVFKADGSLIEYADPFQLVLGGLGVRLEGHRRAGDFDRYLQGVREEVLEARRNAMNALLANNPARATAVAEQFQREFGFPLTFSRAQLRERVKARTVSRSERMVDRLPPELKETFGEMLAAEAPRLGLGAEEVMRGRTATKRRSVLERLPAGTATLDAETVRVAREMMEARRAAEEAVGTPTFERFASYGGSP
jgi:hypothetical protein